MLLPAFRYCSIQNLHPHEARTGSTARVVIPAIRYRALPTQHESSVVVGTKAIRLLTYAQLTHTNTLSVLVRFKRVENQIKDCFLQPLLPLPTNPHVGGLPCITLYYYKQNLSKESSSSREPMHMA